MIYRMKQNAAGLSNICILSTAVIVMLSATISLYTGMEDVLRTRYPRNIIINASDVSDDQLSKLDTSIQSQVVKANILQKNLVYFKFMGFNTIQQSASFTPAVSGSFSANNYASMIFVTQDDYNRIEGKSIQLSEGEALLFVLRGDVPGSKLSINGLELSIKERLSSFKAEGKSSAALGSSYYVIVDNIETIRKVYQSLNNKNDEMHNLSYYYGFDAGSRDEQLRLIHAYQDVIKEIGVKGNVEGPELSRQSFYSIYGGLFFLGLFLGLLFIMATVLIIYY
jgi:putative ABC transport system permease protein